MVTYTALAFFCFFSQDEWNSEKDQALIKLAKLYSENWDMIAKNISGNYTPGQLENKFKVLENKHVDMMEDKIKIETQNEQVSEKEWSTNDKNLVQLEYLFPENWDMVSKNLDENQSPKEVRARFMRLHDLIPEVFFC